jgi:FtsP/CotA-like multicopper oxidase with cupredoxin domain
VPELIPALDVNPDPDIVEINLAATVAEVEYEPGVFTEVLAHRDASVDDSAGTVPGPLIATKQGDRLIVHFVNELPTRFTTVHWHGLRLPAEMDGNPMVSGEVAPGDGFEYDFIVQDAGLFWYHPHVDTDEQLELGLQGPLLVRSPDEPVVDRERYFALDDVELGDDGAVVIEPSRLNTPVDVTLGDVEIWEVINDGDGDHPFHLHGVFFQVLDGGGTQPPALGWKDTTVLGPRSSVRLAVEYTEPGMWMYHCQIPEHAERGMMGDLRVNDPNAM